MRKVSPVANRKIHIHDATIVSNISDSDRFQRHVDFTDQTLVTVESSSHGNYVYDDVTNVSNFEVAEPRSQSCASEKDEGYFSDHEFNAVDPTYHGEIAQEEECKS